MLLRPGAISQEEIEAVLQEKLALPEAGGPSLSPGMKYRHYAPQAKVSLVFCREELRGSFILSQRPRAGERLLSKQTLYAELRNADRIGVSEIEIDCDSSLMKDTALMNRLMRASGQI